MESKGPRFFFFVAQLAPIWYLFCPPCFFCGKANGTVMPYNFAFYLQTDAKVRKVGVFELGDG